jgi:predicted naringenin-chalcone synthase
MSSPTVLFVLDEVLRETPRPAGLGVYGALGPGFTSELGALEGRPVPVRAPAPPAVAAVAGRA